MLRGALRLAVGTVSLATGGWVLRALHGAPAALGAQPADIQAVADRSPNFHDGVFVNLEPPSMSIDPEQWRSLLWEIITGLEDAKPSAEIPLDTPEPRAFDAPASQIAVSWFGHSTALLEIDGYRVLTDPVWSDRCSPSDVIGPARMHPPPVPLEALPALDAIVISHDHYDHLDIDTIIALARSQWAPFVVPLGVGAHLRNWGIPDERVIELDWNESTKIDELTLVCTPARHFSGRFLNRFNTLWASWAIGPAHRAYFGGDTGYTKSFAENGAEHGPFDLTLLPVGAYNKVGPGRSHESRRGCAGASGRTRRVVRPDPLAHLPVGASSVGRADRPAVGGGGRRERRRSGAEPGGRVDPTATAEFEPWWRLAKPS